MHPSIALMLRSPQNRAIAAHILARQGNRGDTMLAHIDPAEALMLQRMGGVGSVNPRTGLRQFYPGQGGAGGMGLGGSGGEAGSDPGGRGGSGGGNGGGGGYGGRPTGPHDAAGYSAGSGYGAPGDSNGGYNGQGRGWAASQTSGGELPNDGTTKTGQSAYQSARDAYNGSVLGHVFGVAPDLSDSATYADGTWHTGFNVGKAIDGLGATLIGGPFGTALSAANTAFGPSWGPNVVLGGPGAPPTEGMYKGVLRGPGAPAGSQGSLGSPGANGGGNGDPRGRIGSSGLPGHGTTPAPGAQPAGLPPAANPALAGLYVAGLASDPFGGRFGSNPFLSPYLIAANQPAARGYLSGLWH